MLLYDPYYSPFLFLLAVSYYWNYKYRYCTQVRCFYKGPLRHRRVITLQPGGTGRVRGEPSLSSDRRAL